MKMKKYFETNIDFETYIDIKEEVLAFRKRNACEIAELYDNFFDQSSDRQLYFNADAESPVFELTVTLMTDIIKNGKTPADFFKARKNKDIISKAEESGDDPRRFVSQLKEKELKCDPPLSPVKEDGDDGVEKQLESYRQKLKTSNSELQEKLLVIESLQKENDELKKIKKQGLSPSNEVESGGLNEQLTQKESEIIRLNQELTRLRPVSDSCEPAAGVLIHENQPQNINRLTVFGGIKRGIWRGFWQRWPMFSCRWGYT